jgi:hypothetical protein
MGELGYLRGRLVRKMILIGMDLKGGSGNRCGMKVEAGMMGVVSVLLMWISWIS